MSTVVNDHCSDCSIRNFDHLCVLYLFESIFFLKFGDKVFLGYAKFLNWQVGRDVDDFDSIDQRLKNVGNIV